MKNKISLLICLLLIILLSGCQSNLWSGEEIFITPATGMMKPGQTLTLEVTVRHRNGNEADTAPVWTVENPVGTLNQTSGKQVIFTAGKTGTTRIKVVANGLTTFAQITVVESALANLTLSPATLRMGLGQTKQLTLTALDQFGDLMTVTPLWTVNPVLGKIDEHNRINATTIGRCTVAVTVGTHAASLDLTVEAPIDIPDPALRSALLADLNKADDSLFPYELEQITELTARDRGIADVTGLQYCVRLTRLDLERNAVTDLGPLSRLTALTELNLRENALQDLAPLAYLTGLRSLLLGDNPLRELKPLEALSALEHLDLSNTWIDNLGDLYGMENMLELNLAYCNDLDDDSLQVLVHMRHLQILNIKGNRSIFSLEPLRGLTSLQELDIRSALIRDLAPLATCTSLQTLIANNNSISDLTPLANLRSLSRVNLSLNLIRDLTALRNLTNLDILYLADNQIEDLTPLVQNTGLGSGDQLDLTGNPLDLREESDDMAHIRTLQERGVVMIGF